jgi:tetratricopeptide (TPR) repeat protein
LDDDPVATLTITDKLYENNQSEATALAHVFGLSQAERPSLAKEKAKLRARRSHSYFVLSDEERLPSPTDPLKDYMEGGLVAACMRNNCGVVHARDGNAKSASKMFMKSRAILLSGKSYLHPYYNLTLVYLEMGKTAKAISLWEHVRQLESTDQKELRDTLQVAAQELELGQDSKTPSRNTWTATGIGGLQPSNVHLLDCFVLRYRLQEMEEVALKDLAAS